MFVEATRKNQGASPAAPHPPPSHRSPHRSPPPPPPPSALRCATARGRQGHVLDQVPRTRTNVSKLEGAAGHGWCWLCHRRPGLMAIGLKEVLIQRCSAVFSGVQYGSHPHLATCAPTAAVEGSSFPHNISNHTLETSAVTVSPPQD